MTQKISLDQIAQNGASNGQAITWNHTTGKWVPSTVASSGGGGGVTLAEVNDLLDDKQDLLGFVPENSANRAQPSGYASLDASGIIPSAQLPAYTGDVTKAIGGTVLTLASVNSNVGTFGGGTSVPIITVNSKGLITSVTTATISLSSYAPLNSPALTGTPTAPTAAATTNSTQLATTAFVQSAITKGFGGFAGGKPSASQVVAGGVSPYAFTIAQANCFAKSVTAAAGSTVFTINKNGASIGTFTFSASGTVAVVSITSSAVAKGDLLTITAPATADASLANISFTVVS